MRLLEPQNQLKHTRQSGAMKDLLLVYSRRMKTLLQEALGEKYAVHLAMRYKNPSLVSVLKEMEKEGFKRIRVIPLFPQYASATTGSVHQKVMELVSHWQTVPDLELVNSYPDHPGLIETVAERASEFDLKSYDHYVFSFHGLPVRQLIKADFNNHCQKNGLLQINWFPQQNVLWCTVSFDSQKNR